jgi:hemoglobin
MQSPYEQLGGEAGVRELVERFYGYMDTLPEAQTIRDLHPQNLQGSIDKLYLFLSGWFGGPNLYVEQYGHPRLRARHLPFPIGDEERDQWMLCMDRALNDLAIDENLRQQLHKAFADMASHMRNQMPPGEAMGISRPDNG